MSPPSLEAQNVSSTSIIILWAPIPKASLNGILLGYRVFFGEKQARRRKRGTGVDRVFTLFPNTTHLLVDDLRKFTVYAYSVLGFTAKGDGVVSAIGEIATDQDGESEFSPIRYCAHQQSLLNRQDSGLVLCGTSLCLSPLS